MTGSSRHRGLLAEGLRVLRDDGARAVWIHTIQVLGIYRRLIVIGGHNGRMPEPAKIPIHCEQLPNEQIGEYLALRPDQDSAEIQARLKRGEACLVARHEGHVVAAGWCATQSAWIEYLDCELLLAEDCVYAYDSYVHSSQRGRRVADGMRRYRMGWIDEAGFARAIGLIWPENTASMRRSQRMSRKVIGDIVRWRIGPWKRVSVRLSGKHADICRVDERPGRRP